MGWERPNGGDQGPGRAIPRRIKENFPSVLPPDAERPSADFGRILLVLFVISRLGSSLGWGEPGDALPDVGDSAFARAAGIMRRQALKFEDSD